MATKVNINALLALNEDFVKALMKGEAWAINHMRICESLNAGESEGFRRPFDGTSQKWCGEACPYDKGCMMCTLPENTEVADYNNEHPDALARLNLDSNAEMQAIQGQIAIIGTIDESMVRLVRLMLSIAKENHVNVLQVEIESNGGTTSAGLEICDMIQSASVERRVGIVKTYARSMALIILQACDERIATPQAKFLLHHSGISRVTVAELRDQKRIKFILESIAADEKRMDEMLTSRTGRIIEEIQAICDQDTDMTSETALRIGLIDGILQ